MNKFNVLFIRRYCFLLILSVGTCNSLLAQQNFIAKLYDIANRMKELRSYGYSYTLEGVSPDGTKEQIKGYVYSDVDRKQLYNINNSCVIWYTDRWYYRAENDTKEITIIDLQKKMPGAVKATKDNDVFNNALATEYIDSFILKYGKVTGYDEKGDTVHITLSFPQGSMKKMSFDYDVSRKMPVKMTMELFYSSGFNDEGKEEGLKQIMTCRDYTTTPAAISIGDYFRYMNGKIKLTKHQDYKLYTVL